MIVVFPVYSRHGSVTSSMTLTTADPGRCLHCPLFISDLALTEICRLCAEVSFYFLFLFLFRGRQDAASEVVAGGVSVVALHYRGQDSDL